MRVLLLAFMLVLLPLRGWAGNVMAVTMAASTMTSASQIDAASADVADPHQHDCPGHSVGEPGGHGDHPVAHEGGEDHAAQHAGSNGTNTHGASHAHGNGSASCGSCAYCQMCHTVALAAPAPLVPALLTSEASPLARLPADLSAMTLPGDKPPIA